MGAVMLGRAMSHARATLAGVESCFLATSSSALRIRNPRSGTLPKISLRAILARKESARQRVVIDNAYPFLFTEWLQLLFIVLAIVEVILRLETFVSGNAQLFAYL
jgi:hypothetical protein